MSEEKTCDVFLKMLLALMQASRHGNTLQECVKRDAEEITKLNLIIDELRDENESLKSVNREMSEDLMRIARGGDA